jgi:hypothetical protein
MAVRVLLVLRAFAILYGCGQASSPVEEQEKQGDVSTPLNFAINAALT